MPSTKVTEKQALDWLRRIKMGAPASEEIAKAAHDLMDAYYWSMIRGEAKDFLKRVNEGEFKSDEELTDAFNADIDSNYWVTYTWWSRVALTCCKNPDAYEEEFGSKPETVEQQAYAAIMQDVSEHPDMQEAFKIARGEDE